MYPRIFRPNAQKRRIPDALLTAASGYGNRSSLTLLGVGMGRPRRIRAIPNEGSLMWANM